MGLSHSGACTRQQRKADKRAARQIQAVLRKHVPPNRTLHVGIAGLSEIGLVVVDGKLD